MLLGEALDKVGVHPSFCLCAITFFPNLPGHAAFSVNSVSLTVLCRGWIWRGNEDDKILNGAEEQCGQREAEGSEELNPGSRVDFHGLALCQTVYSDSLYSLRG